MRVTVCQLDNRAAERRAILAQLARHIGEHESQFLLLPEMCFADWLAADPVPQRERWLAAIKSHAEHILELGRLGVQAVIATRPIVNETGSFRNQACLWTPQPRILPIHEKYYLPNEAGYWEANWYQRGALEFRPPRSARAPEQIQLPALCRRVTLQPPLTRNNHARTLSR